MKQSQCQCKCFKADERIPATNDGIPLAYSIGPPAERPSLARDQHCPLQFVSLAVMSIVVVGDGINFVPFTNTNLLMLLNVKTEDPENFEYPGSQILSDPRILDVCPPLPQRQHGGHLSPGIHLLTFTLLTLTL